MGAGSETGDTTGHHPAEGGSIPTPALHIFQTNNPVVAGKMECRPITLRAANDFVAEHHRHNGRTARNGGKFAVSLWVGESMIGVAILGNPLSATYMDGFTAEALRVCVLPGSPKGACSMLYGALWRAWRAMGGRRLVTYTLESESGASLRGAGFVLLGQTKPTKEGWRKKPKDGVIRTYHPTMGLVKNRWMKAEEVPHAR